MINVFNEESHAQSWRRLHPNSSGCSKEQERSAALFEGTIPGKATTLDGRVRKASPGNRKRSIEWYGK